MRLILGSLTEGFLERNICLIYSSLKGRSQFNLKKNIQKNTCLYGLDEVQCNNGNYDYINLIIHDTLIARNKVIFFNLLKLPFKLISKNNKY